LKFHEKWIFFLKIPIFHPNSFFLTKLNFYQKSKLFFSSESWDIILYCRQIHLVNAPIFWRVSSFEVLLTNKKIAFWNQIQKLARFSSLWVGWSFWHYHCKERPIFDLGLAWFAFITRETTSTKKKPKKPFWRWDAYSLLNERVLQHLLTKMLHLNVSFLMSAPQFSCKMFETLKRTRLLYESITYSMTVFWSFCLEKANFSHFVSRPLGENLLKDLFWQKWW